MPATVPRAAFRRPGVLLIALVWSSGCGDGSGPDDPPEGTGVIQVAVATGGTDLDPDGYVATLDGTGPALSIPPTGSATFSEIAVGDHSVALGGLAANCSADAASRNVTVTDGGTAAVSFTVTCSPPSPPPPPTVGSIRVVTSTIGPDPDPDGYQFMVDSSGPVHNIATSSTATVNDVPVGLRTVALSGLATNCGLPSGWFRSVHVIGGETVDAVFPITCYEMGPSPSQSTIQVDPASIPVGFPGQIHLQMSRITVTVVDGNGTPLPGLAVSVNATGTGNTIHPWPSALDSWLTNASGVATFALSSTDPGAKIITAMVNGVVTLDAAPVITVVKGLSTVSIGGADPEPSRAGEPFVVTATVGGGFGSRPNGGTVTVSSNLEPDAACVAPISPAGDTYSTGTCEMTLSIVSTHMLTATYSGDSQFEGSTTDRALEHVVIAP